MAMEGKDTALKEWVEAKRASIVPPPITEIDPETDAALVGIPKVGEEILGGKYVVEHLMGIGGMGVVCAAMHKQLKQRVAIKFLNAQMRSPELVDRFIREGQAAVRIKSEHIAPVLDVGVLDSGAPYLMMEYLSGADLGDYLLEHRMLAVEPAVDFVLQTLDGLAVAHSAGIVHRDLKPSNLFVTSRSDGSPLIKVLDFGISKITETGPSPSVTLTRPGMMLGSPRYMSPEQLRNASGVDHRADIWAMGVVLHELIAGQPPYDADTFTALCAMIVSDDPTPLRSVRPDAPVLLEEIIQKCLRKKPDERWQDVSELADALAPLAPEESRVIANRVRKILGHKPGKTPAGGYSSTKLSVGTPKPRERTLPLAQLNSGTPPPSSQDVVPSSAPSPMSTTGEPRISAAPLTDPNAGALAISTASPAPKSNVRLFAIVGGLVIGLIAIGVVAMRKPPAPVVATPPPPASTAVAVVAPVPTPTPTPEPVVTAPAASSAEPAVAVPTFKPSIGGRPRPVAKPSAAPSAAPPPTTAAPPSEADMLNRRR